MNPHDLETHLPAARDVLAEAADYVLTHPVTRVWTKDGGKESVTNIDMNVEKLVRRRLCTCPQEIGFFGEETGWYGNKITYWTLDPIDGTDNLRRGLPLWAIALGLVHKRKPMLGVIEHPMMNRTYWAYAGGGAWRNGVRLKVADVTQLSDALIGMSNYGAEAGATPRDIICRRLDTELTIHTRGGMRRTGSTVVDHLWVVEGGLHASVNVGNRPPDVVPGAILAAEAGAKVVDRDGRPYTVDSEWTVVIVPGLYNRMLPLLANVYLDTTDLP